MPSPDLSSSVQELYDHAMEGDRGNIQRSNFQDALAVMQFQVLIAQKQTAKAQLLAAVATFLLFAATIGLILATSDTSDGNTSSNHPATQRCVKSPVFPPC